MWWRAAVAVAALALAAPGIPAAAAGAQAPGSDPAGTTAVGGTGSVRFATVVGVAWQADNTPIPAARVRLRDVGTGRAAGHAVASDAGRFTFQDVLPGAYVVELVNENGKVLTVGHSFTVARGETVATFVRLGARSPWFNGFFANAAAAVASAAASAGVTAIAPDGIRPASATQ